MRGTRGDGGGTLGMARLRGARQESGSNKQGGWQEARGRSERCGERHRWDRRGVIY